jgi:hypothetical protein
MPGQLQMQLLNCLQPEQNTKLYRSYCLDQATHAVLRHRGKSPRQTAFFFRTRSCASTQRISRACSCYPTPGFCGAPNGNVRRRIGRHAVLMPPTAVRLSVPRIDYKSGSAQHCC